MATSIVNASPNPTAQRGAGALAADARHRIDTLVRSVRDLQHAPVTSMDLRYLDDALQGLAWRMLAIEMEAR